MLRGQRLFQGPHRGRTDREDRQQLRPRQLQLRPDAAVLDEGEIPRGVPRRPRRRPGKPQGVLRTRLRPGTGVQPHHPSPGQRPGQGNAGALGDQGLHVPLRAASGGLLAPGDRRGPGNPRGPGPGGDPVHDPRPPPGGPGAGEGGRRLERRQRRPDRSHDPVRARSSLGAEDLHLLLRRTHLPGSRLRAASRQRGVPRQPPAGGILRPAPVAAAAGAYRHRRGDVRPPPHPRRDGAYACDATFRREPGGSRHQLRRAPGEIPAHPRSADHREQFLELRPRRGTLAKQLRMQLRRQPWVEPGVAGTAAGGAGLAPGHHRPSVRRGREEGLQGPVGRPGRVHLGDPRPVRRLRRRISRKTRRRGADVGTEDPGARADGDPAARHAHVHELRVVLRRALGDRNSAGTPVRRPRRTAFRGVLRRLRQNRVPGAARAGKKQRAGT